MKVVRHYCYKAHKSRFNYTFIDGHVEALKIEAAVGNRNHLCSQGNVGGCFGY